MAKEGKTGFYEGETAINIVEAVRNFGGCLSLEDLKNHETTYEEPICTDYKGVRLWEIPPNGQGIVALMALNILEEFDLKGESVYVFVDIRKEQIFFFKLSIAVHLAHYRPHSEGCGNVMFLHLSVCSQGGFPCPVRGYPLVLFRGTAHKQDQGQDRVSSGTPTDRPRDRTGYLGNPHRQTRDRTGYPPPPTYIYTARAVYL